MKKIEYVDKVRKRLFSIKKIAIVLAGIMLIGTGMETQAEQNVHIHRKPTSSWTDKTAVWRGSTSWTADMDMMSPQYRDVCAGSNWYAALYAGSGRPSNLGTGFTMSDSLRNSAVTPPGSPVPRNEWEYAVNKYPMDHAITVCSNMISEYTGGNPPGDNDTPPPPSPTPFPYFCDTTFDREDNFSDSITGVAEAKTDLTQVRVDLSSLSSEEKTYWRDTHKDQLSNRNDGSKVTTSYGEYLKRNKSDLYTLLHSSDEDEIKSIWENFKDGAEITKSQGIPEMRITLTDKNKEGFAKGGAFNVVESHKNATYGITVDTTRTYRYDCGVASDGGWDGSYSEVLVSKSSDANVTENGEPLRGSRESKQSYYPYSMYQMIASRCNLDDMIEVKNATNGEFLTYGSGNGSNTIKTETQYNNFEYNIGDAFSNNEVLRKTAEATFYTDTTSCEETAYCDSRALREALANGNDSGNNKQNNGQKINGTYGAQSEENLSDSFQFFRDNVSKTIRLDVWYPKAKENAQELQHNVATKATNTALVFSPEGTPVGDLFNLENSNADKVLFSGSNLSSNNSIMLTGQENVFNVRASFSSEKENPHKFNTYWYYKPNILTNVPSTLTNLEPAGMAPIGYPIIMSCESTYNTIENVKPKVENTLIDKDPTKPTKFDDTENKSLNVSFVRASTE